MAGPTLAGRAFEACLVDECHSVIAPVVVGGGKRCLPTLIRVHLDLLEERRFGNGMVHLRNGIS